MRNTHTHMQNDAILPKFRTPSVHCVILSGAAIGSAVEESYAYPEFDTEKILRLRSG